MKKGLLIILSGPSGVGKGTVRKHIMKDKTLRLHYSISMTTREKRIHETDGVEYYFVTPEQFQNSIDNGNFLEWCEFVGNRYGTPKDKVEELRNKGENVFLEIEVNGASQVLDKLQGDEGVVSIFLLPPSIKALENRIRKRKTESEEIIQARLEKGKSEMNKVGNYKYIVLNDQVTKASNEICRIIREEIADNYKRK
ncbi:MAG: guanylate kinase [Bacilli bacterium]